MTEPTIPAGWFRPGPVDSSNLARDAASARRRAFLTVALLAGQVAITAFGFALWLRTQRLLGGPGMAPIAALFGIDHKVLALGVLSLITYAVTGALFIAWLRKVVAVARVVSPETMTYGTGIATFGWFIPFANLVLPYLVVRQATLALGGAAGTRGAGTRRLVLAWWLVWIGTNVANPILLATSTYDAAVELAYLAGSAVSAVLAIAAVAKVQGLVAGATDPRPGAGAADAAPEPSVIGVRNRIGWFRGAVLAGTVLFSLASLPAMLAPQATTATDAVEWVREDLPQHGISLAHPAWFKAIPAEGERDDGFTTLWLSGDSRPTGGNGVLGVGYLDAEGATLDDFRLGFQSVGAEVVDTTLQDLPALMVKVENDGDAGTIDHAYATVWRDRVYMLVLTAPADRIDEYADDLARVARSFRYRAPLNRT